MPMKLHTLPICATALLLAIGLSGHAGAHDTWFELRAPGPGSEARLALGTGNRFPVMEFPLGIEQLRHSGCRGDAGAPLPLAHDADEPNAVRLRAARAADDSGALTCWAQTQAFEVELTPTLVTQYLKEIQAPPAVHQAWAAQRARGQRWTERYTKHARIELPDADGRTATAAPTGMALDLLLLGGPRALRAGDSAEFQLLRDGQPLAGQALELHGEHGALGFWRRTDADGRVRFTLPLPGRWVLRGTELRPADSGDMLWDSRFVTLAFSVGTAPVASKRGFATLLDPHGGRPGRSPALGALRTAAAAN
jgi:hypothetical protein